MLSTRKLLISIGLGLAGFGLSLFSLRYSQPPFTLTLTWSYMLPLLAGLAYGPLYGLIAGTLGLGAFYPFLLYPNNGWANLVNSIAVALWFPWYGYFAALREKQTALGCVTRWNQPFLVHLPYAVFYVVFMRLGYPLAFSFNPPPWNPTAELEMPASILTMAITKGVLMMYLVMLVDVSLLKVSAIRRLLGLEVKAAARDNGWIVLSAGLSAVLFWFVLVVLERILITQNLPFGLPLVFQSHEILALVVFLAAGFSTSAFLCPYVESRYLAEERLSQSRESYRQVFEQAADGIFIAGGNGDYVEVNASGCELTGYTRAEFLGLNTRDVVIAQKQVNPAMGNGAIQAGKAAIFERSLRRKDGSVVQVEVSPSRLPDGRIQEVVRDLTGRKQAEEALQASNELLSHFLHYSPIYAYIKEVTPTRSLVLHASENFADMVGIPGSQMVGKDMNELFPPEFAARITAQDWEVVTGGRVLNVEEELNARCYTTIKFPIISGQKTLLAGYSIDVSERKSVEMKIKASQAVLQHLLNEAETSRRALLSLLEDQKAAEDQVRQLNTNLERHVKERTAQLAAANQELEAFAYSVSHDLRAPLRALEGFSNVLIEDYAGQLDVQGQHYLSRIQEAARRMGQLISDLLNLSKVTRAEIKHQQVDLSQLAQSIALELEAQAPERKLKFTIAAGIQVRGDLNLLKIALDNLLNNAFKFSAGREEACIEVGEVEQSGERIYFVRDNGAGFDMAYAGKLFAPFQRLHSTSEFPGSGIGLSIVQRIIARHGGRIWPESAIDRGATFYFSLPDSDPRPSGGDPLRVPEGAR